MSRRLLLAVLAATALFGCQRREPAKAPASTLPQTYVRNTPDARVKLTLEPAIAEHIGLHQKLHDEGVLQLDKFLAYAKQDRARLEAKGLQMAPYERTVSWSITAQTPALLSVQERWFDYTGGAHPNHGSSGLLWSVRRDRELTREELLRPGADRARLDQVLCDAVKAAKAARHGAMSDDAGWSCPKWSDGDFVLAPSTVPGKIGGITFLFDPYAIGPYSEGEYVVTLPLSAFGEALSPTYAPEFAGAPRPGPPDPRAPAPAAG